MQRALAELVAASADGGVDIDALGDVCSRANAAPDEVDALITELESRGIVVRAPAGGGGEERLGVVLQTARALRTELGRTPTAPEIAARSGLDVARVRQALALARVIAR
jgi:hypothetical protein